MYHKNISKSLKQYEPQYEIECVTNDIQDIYPLGEKDLDFKKIYPLTNIK